MRASINKVGSKIFNINNITLSKKCFLLYKVPRDSDQAGINKRLIEAV